MYESIPENWDTTNTRLSPLTNLKLPSLFAAWRFWTFHTKSHNMKALLILSHSWSPFSYLLIYMEKNNFCGSLWCLLDYFLENKLPSDYPCKSHDHDHQFAKENVNITLLDLCLFTFYSVHADESTWHWL